MNTKKLLLLACACCTLLQAKDLTITTKVTCDDAAEAAVRKELDADSKAITRKYAGAQGVRSVETNVDETRCEACGTGNQDAETKCGCGKPTQKCDDCSNVAGDQDAVEECTDCQGHTQAEDKITKNEDGQEVCSNCNETLRSCSSCCKKKCCNNCKKCCSKCSSCSSSSSSCCS